MEPGVAVPESCWVPLSWAPSAGFATEIIEDLTSLQWGKLAANVAINPLTALLRVSNGALVEDAHALGIMGEAAREAAAVAAALNVRLVAGLDTLRLIRGRATLRGMPGDVISFLPLMGDAQGVTLSGLEYPLTNAVLRFGYSTGVSNVLVGQEAVISVRHGLLLAIHTRQA